MTDLDLTDAELARVAPYVQSYLDDMAKVAHLDLTSIEPESLDPASFLKALDPQA